MDLKKEKIRIPKVSKELERKLYDLVMSLKNDNIGSKNVKKSERFPGFYFYFLRALSSFHYSMGAASFEKHIEDIETNSNIYRKLLNSHSGRFQRLLDGSEEAISDLSEGAVIDYPTLANSLSILELFIFLEKKSLWEILEIFRSKEELRKLEEKFPRDILDILQFSEYEQTKLGEELCP